MKIFTFQKNQKKGVNFEKFLIEFFLMIDFNPTKKSLYTILKPFFSLFNSFLVYLQFSLLFVFLIFGQNVFGQNTPKMDSLKKEKKTVDTIKVDKNKIGDITTTVIYYGRDSIVTDLDTETVYIYGEASIKYGDIDLTASQIQFDQRNNLITARGTKDTTGKWIGRPIFKQGQDNYESDSILYNIKSQKAIVKGIVTKQGEGYITSRVAKRGGEGEMYAGGGCYTTCNLKHPHWYISAKKIKMIPQKQIVAGPFHLVIADVPTPLGFIFGIFPFTQTRRSGIIVPTYGEAVDRGFYLRQGGYYWAVNKYMAAEFLGEIYTNGSWGLSGALQYTKKYRMSGSANIRFNKRYQGEQATREEFQDFWISWTHTPVPRGRGSFNASVNLGTTSFNRRNDFNPNNQLANNFSSSISYNTNFNIGGSMITFSVSARHDQNSNTNIMNVALPSMNIGVNRIYLFKKLDFAPNFIKQLSIAYTFRADARFSNQAPSNSFGFAVSNLQQLPLDANNQPIVPDFNGGNLDYILRNAKMGASHNIPISTTIKVLKYFSLNPTLSYQETWYPNSLAYTWLPTNNAVRVDTVAGFARVYGFSASMTLNTRFFGIFKFGKKSKIQAIRHTVNPNITYSYAPDFSRPSFGFTQEIQTDAAGKIQNMSRFIGFEPAASIGTGQSAIINFSVANIFEAKLRGQTDTSQARKINILDNFSFNGSFAPTKDTFKLSTIGLSARTKLLGLIDLNMSGSLDPYTYRETFESTTNIKRVLAVDTYAWQAGKGLGNINNANVAFAFDLTPKSFKKNTENKLNEAEKNLGTDMRNANAKDQQALEQKQDALKQIKQNPNEYVDFDIPWQLQVNYNMQYSKANPFVTDIISHQLNFSGNISLTKTWKMVFRSGYDFTAKNLSFTNIDIYKDLHCWEMRFNWNPFGQFQSWNFGINVKSSMLQDLKLTRQRSWYDRGFVR